MSRPRIRPRARTWAPYLPPVPADTADPAKRAAMGVSPSNTGASPYVRTLAHDPDSHVTRTDLFNRIMYAPDGLDRASRELAAFAASRVNGCVYCAAVHGRRYVELSRRDDVLTPLIADGLDGAVDDRSRAIVDMARALNDTPAAVTPAHANALKREGLDDGEKVDVVLAAAIFGWANRLMHTLGHSTPQKRR